MSAAHASPPPAMDTPTRPATPRAPHATFGQLGELLARTTHGRELLASPGPVADAFVADTSPVALLNGPRGSCKTTTVFRKMVGEGTRMRPLPFDGEPNGKRLYVPQVMRPKYKNLWGTTIKSWWKLFPVEAFPNWTGGNGRDADHVIQWRDSYGLVEMRVLFRAIAEGSEEEDARGSECTDLVPEEMDTHDENILINMTGSLARQPVRSLMNRDGKIFGSCNAPDVTNWAYRDFWETKKPGYKLYRQPGGLEPDAENIHVVTRGYYLNQMEINAARPWWINKMIHNRPGYSRDHDVILPDFDDSSMVAPGTLGVMRELPVVVGFDGGNTPAATFWQFPADGTANLLAEVSLMRGDEDSLAEACLTVMAHTRFMGAEFVGCSDPAMDAGNDLPNGSMRSRLEKKLGFRILSCHTNDPEERHGFLRDFTKTRRAGRPGLLIDPSCKVFRRGANQTFHYHEVKGAGGRGNVVKNADSHTMESGEYACSLSGKAVSRRRQSDILRQRQQSRDQKGKTTQRYNPLTRRYGG